MFHARGREFPRNNYAAMPWAVLGKLESKERFFEKCPKVVIVEPIGESFTVREGCGAECNCGAGQFRFRPWCPGISDPFSKKHVSLPAKRQFVGRRVLGFGQLANCSQVELRSESKLQQ